MSSDSGEEYYFEDDVTVFQEEDGDDAQESGAERLYEEAKELYDQGDLSGAVELFSQMLVILEEGEEEDGGGGGKVVVLSSYWTWKAHKNLAKCTHKQKDYAKMITHVQNMLGSTHYEGGTRHDVEKAIGKFIDRVNNTLPGGEMTKNHQGTTTGISDNVPLSPPTKTVAVQFYTALLDRLLVPERRNYEKLWFSVKMKLCQIYLHNVFSNIHHTSVTSKKITIPTKLKETRCLNADVNEHDDADGGHNYSYWLSQLESELQELTAFCSEGENAEQRKGTMLLTVLALEMQLRTQLNDTTRLRELYTVATSTQSVVLGPKQTGVIRECGGRIFMRQSLWKEAQDCFGSAFRAFDEAGGGGGGIGMTNTTTNVGGSNPAVRCLKYLLLASMLAGSTINPMHTPEARSYLSDPEVLAMTQLLDACHLNDMPSFQKNAALFGKEAEDSFLSTFLNPLIRKVRCNALQVLVKPYHTIKLSYIATELQLKSIQDAEALVVSMVLEGCFGPQGTAQIDQVQGLLKKDSSRHEARSGHLCAWVDTQKLLQEGIRRKAATILTPCS